MNEKTWVTIVQETDKNVILKTIDGDVNTTLPKTEFYNFFRYDPEMNAYFLSVPDDMQAEIEKQRSRLEWFMPRLPIILLASAMKQDDKRWLAYAGAVGGYVKEYMQEFPGQTPTDFVENVRILKQWLTGNVNLYEDN